MLDPDDDDNEGDGGEQVGDLTTIRGGLASCGCCCWAEGELGAEVLVKCEGGVGRVDICWPAWAAGGGGAGRQRVWFWGLGVGLRRLLRRAVGEGEVVADAEVMSGLELGWCGDGVVVVGGATSDGGGGGDDKEEC